MPSTPNLRALLDAKRERRGPRALRRLFFLGTLLCGGFARPRAEETAAASAAARGYNVVIVDFDTLRADRLGALGNPRPLTPNLDALAARSYLFTAAVAQAPWTLPSTMSFFTSVYPHQHGVLNKFTASSADREELARLPRRFSTLAQVFRSNGYATAGFTGDAGVAANFGFGGGFDVYYDSITFGGFDTTLPLAEAWLKSHQDRKFFLFIHGYDVHGQFPVPADFKSRFADPGYRGPFSGSEGEFMDLRMKTIKREPLPLSTADARFWMDRYDEKTVRADERFGRFWKTFSALPAAKRTIVVVVGDHGEQFGEHGGFDHGTTLYDEVLRVPLIIHAPDGAAARIDGQVRLIDVMPTLTDWLGLATTTATLSQMQGSSLLPLMRGRPLPLDAFSETSFLLQVEKCSLRTSDGWKLVYDLEALTPELYDLRLDPGEKNNVAARQTARVETLTRRLLQWNASFLPAAP
jgi:arylsulfatase A-like enzyme